MLQVEFDNGILKLSAKWKSIFSSHQLSLLWDKWQKLPNGIFDVAVNAILFKATAIPSGEKLQEEINAALECRTKTLRMRSGSDVVDNGCVPCQGRGYLMATNSEGNETICLCNHCEGKGVPWNFKPNTRAYVMSKGYTRIKEWRT